MSSEVKHIYGFGPYRLDSGERVLRREGVPVPMSPKVFEILFVLVRNSGHIVEKDRLLEEVWPDAFVEEGNINVHVSALRKALGESTGGEAYIETIPRRGYRFVAPVEVLSEDPAPLVIQRRRITRISQEEEISTIEEAAVQPSPILPAQAALPAREADHKKLSRSVALACGLCVVIGLSGLAAFLLSRGPAKLDRASFSGNKLLAWNERGKVAWDYRFSQPLFTDYPTENSRLIQIGDFNNDGRQELLAAVPFAQEGSSLSRNVVYCFSADGKVLWTYEPKIKLEFGEKTYEGPWHAWDMLVSPQGVPRAIWVAFSHLTWWPAFIVRLDPQGGGALQFVNSGHLHRLDYVENRTGTYLLAAGMNNELQSAVLAVLATDQPLSVSPQNWGSIYQSKLLGAGASFPYRYFAFQPSELFRMRNGRFHNVFALSVRNNSVQVQTFEGQDPLSPSPYLVGFYDFTPDFDLVSATFDDDYWMLHRQMEREGKITHAAAQCPDRAHRVRAFLPEKLWSEVPVVPPAGPEKVHH